MTTETPYHLDEGEWNAICAQIRASEPLFYSDPWLDRLAFMGCSWSPKGAGGTLCLKVPNHLYQEFIQENLEPILLYWARELCGAQGLSVHYRLGEVS